MEQLKANMRYAPGINFSMQPKYLGRRHADLGCRDWDLLGVHHQAIASVDPRILQLLHVSCVYSLRDHCLDD
jgi:hypothetical protein